MKLKNLIEKLYELETKGYGEYILVMYSPEYRDVLPLSGFIFDSNNKEIELVHDE
jgi:hypothetical protein